MKKFKTTKEQLEILHSRGLIISDYQRAKQYLLTNNYYNIINGYSKFFEKSTNVYYPGTSFDEIAYLYFMDTELKNAMFEAILSAENHLKSITSYRFSEKYPNERFSYLNINSYQSNKAVKSVETIAKFSRKINRNSNRNSPQNPIKHYIDKYDDVPIWVIIDYLTLGELYFFLLNLDKSIQNKVAKTLCSFISDHCSVSSPFTPEIMLSFLKNINEARNVCAHGSRLIGFNCRGDSHYYADIHNRYDIQRSDQRRSVYSVFLSLQCYISKIQYAKLHNTFRKRIENFDRKLNTIDINSIITEYGFPENWHKNTKKIKHQNSFS